MIYMVKSIKQQLTNTFKLEKNNEKVSRTKRMTGIVSDNSGILNINIFNLQKKNKVGDIFSNGVKKNMFSKMNLNQKVISFVILEFN